MNKKIILISVIVVAVLVSAYFLLWRDNPSDNNPSSDNLNGEVPTLEEGFGILESEISIDNVYPGWSGEIPLTIINGKDESRVFAVSLRQPTADKVKAGYEVFPSEYFFWVTISEPEVSIEAGDYHKVMIVFSMPNSADYNNKHAELRVRVSEANPSGLVQLAVESRWYITTAAK